MPSRHRGFYHTLALLLLLASAPLAHAAPVSGDASAFILGLGDQTVSAISNTTTSPADRVRRFAVIVDRNLDVPKIAQFVLGRYWKTASDSERTDFINVFRDYIVRVYANHFSLYHSDSFRVTDQRAESATTTIVRSSITAIATDQTMTLEWRVIKGPEGFKVDDLTVGGVSLATVQREEFASALQRDGGTISILTNQVRSKLMRLEAAEQ